jgi:hypothetical protein
MKNSASRWNAGCIRLTEHSRKLEGNRLKDLKLELRNYCASLLWWQANTLLWFHQKRCIAFAFFHGKPSSKLQIRSQYFICWIFLSWNYRRISLKLFLMNLAIVTRVYSSFVWQICVDSSMSSSISSRSMMFRNLSASLTLKKAESTKNATK